MRNRRWFLGLLGGGTAAAVVAPTAAKGAIAASAPPATAPLLPIGSMIDECELWPSYPFHSHSQVVARHVKKIWDGENFVLFDSPEGTAVWNKIIAR